MNTYPVAEIFESINGEGTQAGKLAVFIRFSGCNLRCSFCDTMWANETDCPVTNMTIDEIYNRIKRSGICRVTVTGGEPLLQPEIHEFLALLLKDDSLSVEIETNGSVPLDFLEDLPRRPLITMDYKLPLSGMEIYMCTDNFKLLRPSDTIKFVAGSVSDMDRALEIIEKYQLNSRCQLYFSPVFGKIDPVDMVNYIKEHKLNHITLQLQMHKFIWDPDKKGV